MRLPALAIALLAALALTCASALAATWVSYPELLAQVRSGPVIRAIINRTRGDVEIKFRDLSEWEAFYPRRAAARRGAEGSGRVGTVAGRPRRGRVLDARPGPQGKPRRHRAIAGGVDGDARRGVRPRGSDHFGSAQAGTAMTLDERARGPK